MSLRTGRTFNRRRAWLGAALSTLLAGFAIAAGPAARGHAQVAPTAPNAAIVIELSGVIGVAAASFVVRGIEQARSRNAPLVVLRLDTPGGLVSSTREIVSAVLASKVPVAVYVAPSGARAASAGTYIVYAAHIAAMAPGTHIGAATPVSLGAPPGLPGTPEPKEAPKDERKEEDKSPATANERKSLNDAVAYLRTLAQLRGRNADFAEQAVRTAATMTAREALDARVIEIVADSIAELLTSIDGRSVSIEGEQRRLSAKDIPIETLAPDWRTRLIAVVTDPNVAYLLLLIGFYGILFEIWNPGFVFPGVIGGICLLMALAALAVLPVSYAGLALIVLGIALMVAEVFTPGVLVLGIGGVVAFVVGSIFLFDPGDVTFTFGVSWPMIVAATLCTAVFMFVVLGLALRARQRPVVTGPEEMIASTGHIIDWSGDRGRVHVHGEIWQARAAAGRPVPAAGAKVRIVALDGLTAVVEPAAAGEPPGR
jgi:membrane-bound serine protease (ClpP class)